MKIKVDRITPRIQYTCDFVFRNRGIDFKLVLDGSCDYDYTTDVNASSLLYEELIEINPTFDQSNQVFVFDDKEDLFASIFYVLSRMEEYSHPDRDHHDRFTASQSVLNKYGLLQKAICDRWAQRILDTIGIDLSSESIGFEPTFDIDNTYAYRHKIGIRRSLSILRDRIQRNTSRLKERKVVEQGGRDPYDTFDFIRDIATKFSVRVFWLVESKGKFDRNLDINHFEHQRLIADLSESVSLGIHPSYESFESVSMVTKERETLEKIIEKPIDSSRQHYLRFGMPESYRVLLRSGIKNDYTMGFADGTGFRAGTARSFRWYDLLEESETDLMIHPFVYMDGTLNEYLGLTPNVAMEEISKLYQEVKKCGGTYRFIWHNETIGDYNHWKGWKAVLDHTLTLHHE